MKFRDEYWFLSNMYPCVIEYKGMKFSCSEALFQALKCCNDKDMQLFVGIDGYKAKSLGRSVKLRSDWNTFRLNAMWICLTVKFQLNPELRTLLKNTGDIEIVEDNSWGDYYWGKCNGIGDNNLGKMLMKLRDYLK